MIAAAAAATAATSRFAPTLSEVGIESLTVFFKLVPYPGHFHEPGMNGVFMTLVRPGGSGQGAGGGGGGERG